MPDQKQTMVIRDTDEHEGDKQSFLGHGSGLVKVVNTLDQDVSVRIEVTTFDDKEFDEVISYVTEDIVAGATGYISVVGAWPYARAMVTAAGDPITGDVYLVWDFKQAPVDPDMLTSRDKGVVDGVCPLDGDVKIPVSYIPASVLDHKTDKGPWDASGGTLPVSPANGDTYRISVAGTLPGVGYAEVGDMLGYYLLTTTWTLYQTNMTVGDQSGNVQENGANLNATEIVETNVLKKFITAVKASAYNKAFGIVAGSVTEGHLAALLGGRGGGQTISGDNTFMGSGRLQLKSQLLKTVGVLVAGSGKLGIGFALTDPDPTEVCEVKSGNIKFIGTGGRTRNMFDPLLAQDGDTLAARQAAIAAHVALLDPHTQYQLESEKDAALGYPGLDAGGLINPAQLPPLAITETYVVSNEAAQLALTIQEGDVAVRTDQNKSHINTTGSNTSMADWQELLTPTDAVLSVFSRVGAVTAQNGDYTASQVTNVPAGAIVAVTTQAAINELDTEKEPTFSKNTAFNDDYGTGSGQVCAGNDARLSDTRNITVYRQAAEPTLGADDDIAVWVDTDDSNTTYLVFRVASGTQVKWVGA